MSDADLIGRIEALAVAAGANDLAAEAAELAERLRDERFFVACVGQFKRGKSTLLNALVGRPVLPTGVLPVTSVPTILREGEAGARFRTRSGWTLIALEELASIVTEQQNPGNQKGVQAVEVFLPATALEDGLCLVDTPGLGSVQEANSAATRAFVPHIDAALVVLGADPPFSGEELRLVRAIAAEVDSLIFVVNKVDRVSPDEREQATDFLRSLLVERLGIVPDCIYQVVATGSGGGPDWCALVERLRTLARARRESLVGAAQRRGLSRIG
ncbi:MAG TPA: dynamin family protein, partial [Gemmatimonadales bacterium]|nr:dynamin family protein [Gemmatimonadales bacterium]